LLERLNHAANNHLSGAYHAVRHRLGHAPGDGRSRKPGRAAVQVRYVAYLLWEFRIPLGVFAALVLGGGLALHHLYGKEPVSYGKAFYAVFLMIFIESQLEFPDEWYLQPLFFLVPVIGLGALADSVVRLAYLMFTKKQRLPEWQRMMASLYRNHVVVVGVGRVGMQVIKGLLELNEQVVAVDNDAEESLIDELHDLDIPVIRGNVRSAKTLEQAGVRHASAVLLTTADDLTNLDSGLTARDLNAEARIVLRLYDETLASKVSGAFAMPTISTAHVSAPAFIAAATGRKVYQEFQLAGRTVHLTDLVIDPSGGLAGLTVGEVQTDRETNLVMHQGPSGVDLNPAATVVLSPGDTVLVIAPIDRLLALEARNTPPADGPPVVDAPMPSSRRDVPG
jgi:Trk K+ transport system NAD-binding subunit